MPASYYITHLNTARNSQTKKPSVIFSGALFLLFHEQPRQFFRHARDLCPPQRWSCLDW